jgi:hypothetical protein
MNLEQGASPLLLNPLIKSLHFRILVEFPEIVPEILTATWVKVIVINGGKYS